MTRITTVAQLQSLQNETLIVSVVVFLATLAVAWFVTSLISYRGGNDRSYITRRYIFIILGIVSGLGFWLYNEFGVMAKITKPGLQSQFGETNLWALVIVLAGYFILGVVLMFAFRKSKFGSILGKGKE